MGMKGYSRMSAATPTRIGMSLDEFIEPGNDQPFELIDGERKPKLPNVNGHNEVAQNLFSVLRASKLGEAVIEGVFILPDQYDANWVTGSRIPDVMFYVQERFAKYKAENPDYWQRHIALVPDLVIEINSPNDKVSELDAKIDLYLADGVKLMWIFDPQRRKVTIRAIDQEQPTIIKGDSVLEAEDLLPGFKLALKDVFTD